MPRKQKHKGQPCSPDIIPKQSLPEQSEHTTGWRLAFWLNRALQRRHQPKAPGVPPTPWVFMSMAYLPVPLPAGHDSESRQRPPLAAQAERPSLHTHAPVLHSCGADMQSQLPSEAMTIGH